MGWGVYDDANDEVQNANIYWAAQDEAARQSASFFRSGNGQLRRTADQRTVSYTHLMHFSRFLPYPLILKNCSIYKGNHYLWMNNHYIQTQSTIGLPDI